MEIGYGIPNGLHENFEDGKDIKMSEFEEGELVEMVSKTELGENSAVVSKIESQETRAGTENLVNKDSGSKNQNRRKKEKKQGNKGTPGPIYPTIRDMSRFVTTVCKRLRIRKAYLLWNAAACLGVSALCDLVNEAEEIQACGGHKTADGRCLRDIFWNIIKTREPNAYNEILERGLELEMGHYREIMRKGREFEKQLKQVPKTPLIGTPLIEQEATDATSQNAPGSVTDQPLASALGGSSLPSDMVCNSQELPTSDASLI